jgi:hypothetical protein
MLAKLSSPPNSSLLFKLTKDALSKLWVRTAKGTYMSWNPSSSLCSHAHILCPVSIARSMEVVALAKNILLCRESNVLVAQRFLAPFVIFFRCLVQNQTLVCYRFGRTTHRLPSGHTEPAPTSAPSIHWMPVITQLWMNRTSTELIFGFTLVTYSVANNRSHIYLQSKVVCLLAFPIGTTLRICAGFGLED